ncbi:MAG: hypothetical protein A3I05_09020 [Deltaproteobacteria bacterium RIFCSPLOWO2_02_FULL_44_10]|nr:MAG: hypothetical protein A3C46_08595 [Deltaproteobacteria bacterium RIFCSPHIGHO2_02_FULL_44_16]OGQ45246.1 MAG: hypothetical protein A3I05_09020 [Deltaproteobacteria bacterium RIFCSPLOWO2_02_FULL_44_10]
MSFLRKQESRCLTFLDPRLRGDDKDGIFQHSLIKNHVEKRAGLLKRCKSFCVFFTKLTLREYGVIPAKAGIQKILKTLDPRLREDDIFKKLKHYRARMFSASCKS